MLLVLQSSSSEREGLPCDSPHPELLHLQGAGDVSDALSLASQIEVDAAGDVEVHARHAHVRPFFFFASSTSERGTVEESTLYVGFLPCVGGSDDGEVGAQELGRVSSVREEEEEDEGEEEEGEEDANHGMVLYG